MARSLPIFSYVTVEPVFTAVKNKQTLARISTDLGLSVTELKIEAEGIRLESGQIISFDQLRKVLKHQNRCYIYDEGELIPLVIYSEETGWVRTLYPTREAPTTLVSGILMHRIKDIDPWEDTRRKISCLGNLSGGRVLDTSFGLGYSALQAAKQAAEVVTVDIDPAAFEMAQLNPWSNRVFELENVSWKVADIQAVIHDYCDTFSHIIHDPPTQKLAGELYSLDLYRDFYRALKRKGVLFHYVGDPQSSHGASITRGVVSRLKEAGFETVKPAPKAFGVVAFKTR